MPNLLKDRSWANFMYGQAPVIDLYYCPVKIFERTVIFFLKKVGLKFGL